MALVLFTFGFRTSAFGFEGRITATLTRGGEAQNQAYIVGTNFLRIERLETNMPHACDIMNLQTGEITLLFPHNRSFVRFTPAPQNEAAGEFPVPPSNVPDAGAFPQRQMPPGIGPQPGGPAGIPNAPGAMPMMTPMPMRPMEKLELVQTNGTTNILGLTCSRYVLKDRAEVVEIWATEQLFPFHPYLGSQPHRRPSRMLEERWMGILAEKKLFPLRAVLRFENGPERLHFEVKSITPEKIKKEDESELFTPPAGYYEIDPLPF